MGKGSGRGLASAENVRMRVWQGWRGDRFKFDTTSQYVLGKIPILSRDKLHSDFFKNDISRESKYTYMNKEKSRSFMFLLLALTRDIYWLHFSDVSSQISFYLYAYLYIYFYVDGI